MMLLAAIFLFSGNSCEPYTIRNATKSKQIPGLPNLKSYVVYSFEVEALDSFAIQKIELSHKNMIYTFLNYSILNKNSRTGFGVHDSVMPMSKGTYQISFRATDSSLFEVQNDYFKVSFLHKNKKLITKKIKAIPIGTVIGK